MAEKDAEFAFNWHGDLPGDDYTNYTAELSCRKNTELQPQLRLSLDSPYNSAHASMKFKAAWKYVIVLLGIALTAAATFWLFKSKPNCLASRGQIVVKWKDMYWVHCKYSWNGYCLWPIRRKHSTYKVAVQEGIPVRDEKGMPIATAGGKIRNWTVYDSVAWNRLEKRPSEKNRFLDYEPIAENEYVVLVETRYRLFHNVEATLRMCTQKP